MSNSSNKETPNVIFKGSGFYITDSRNTSHIDIQSDTSELAHVASCSCAACASASSHEHPVSHSDHDHKHDNGHDQSVEVATIQQGDHPKEEHATEIPVVAELPTERKYLPLNQIGAEALSIGQFLPIVELVQVQHGSTTVLQGRVGILYKTVTGKRAARTMRHTIPLEGFAFSKDTIPHLLEQNFRILQSVVMIDAPAVLATLLYDDPAHFGNSHTGNTPNHLVTGISTTRLALQQLQAKSEGNTQGLIQAAQSFSTLGMTGKKIVHGLHDGVAVQHHEAVGGTATTTWQENERGLLVNAAGHTLVAAYVLPGVNIHSDLGVNNRVLQLPISHVAEKLSKLQQSGISVPDAPALVATAVGKLESAGNTAIVDQESGEFTNVGQELIQDVAETPQGNQFRITKRANQ